MERKINEEFQYKKHKLIVIESDDCNKCHFRYKSCFLDEYHDIIGECGKRSDGKNVAMSLLPKS